MTIRQLEVFLAIAHAQSFSRAAEHIHLSQPTLSQHMGELEDELGVRLFVRHSRSVSLTEAGRARAQALAQRLSSVPVIAVYTTPLQRTRQTATPTNRFRFGGQEIHTKVNMMVPHARSTEYIDVAAALQEPPVGQDMLLNILTDL